MFTVEMVDKAVAERILAAEFVLQRETTNWLVDMAMWMKGDLQQRVPVKTGALKASVRYELSKSADGGEAKFFSIYYGQHVDEGTKPFTIQAMAGHPMRFVMGSEEVFAMTVKHPGIKPRNFTIETLNAAEVEAGRQTDMVADRVWRAIIG